MKYFNRKIVLYNVILSSLLFFVGCASQNVVSKEPLPTVTLDKSKAYIAFAYDPPKFFGAPTPAAILYEFDTKTYEQKTLIEFDDNAKFIQTVTPGNHYYILRRVMPALAIAEDVKYQFTVNAQQGKITYIDLQSLKVMTPERKMLEKKIQEMTCTTNNLNKYGFEKVKSDVYKSPLLGDIEISCKNDKVVKLSPSDSLIGKMGTLKSLTGLPIVRSAKSLENYKLLDKEDIKVKYQLYHVLHKDAIQKYPFEILQYPDQSNEHKYANIQLDINLPQYLNTEDKSEVSKIIKNEFKSYISSSGPEQLKIICNVKNYIPGNRMGRYSAWSIDDSFEKMSSINISVDLMDASTGKKVGKIEATGILAAGALGGSTPDMIKEVSESILNYIKAVYLK